MDDTNETPILQRLAKAAKRLGMDGKTLRKMAREDGEFEVIEHDPNARHKIFYLRIDEVEAFGRGGLPALRDFRAKRRRRQRVKA